MVESSDWDFTRQKNDRKRGKKVKGSARNNSSDVMGSELHKKESENRSVWEGVRL